MTDSELKVVEKLQRAQARREKRYASLRCVYTYKFKTSEEYSDNLILLPKATKSAHKSYLSTLISRLTKEQMESVLGFQVFYIGDFDKSSMAFDKVSPVMIIDIDEIIELIKKEKDCNK